MIEGMAELHASEGDRRELHDMVEHIPPRDLPAARKILRALADPGASRVDDLAALLSD
ncbi:MAG TPA: hypothetical protein VGZ73_20515 [Bryobacteraceae bacterium]|jgi:hypothetical protein|nr:hypothetical protein [Bryobacteraceae bacterium]